GRGGRGRVLGSCGQRPKPEHAHGDAGAQREAPEQTVAIDPAQHGQLLSHSAASPRSPVRMRTTWSSALTKTFPSPNLPVLAVLRIASTAASTISSARATSILILGRNSTLYSLPR